MEELNEEEKSAPRYHGQVNLKLGYGGEILDVPENREFMIALDRAEILKPQRLLQLASQFSSREATKGLGEHLAREAVKSIVKDPLTKLAVSKIADEQVGFSLFGDIWNSIVGFFTGTNPGNPQGSPNPNAPFPCQHKCVGFIVEVLVERCWTGVGDRYGPWHLVGACIGIDF